MTSAEGRVALLAPMPSELRPLIRSLDLHRDALGGRSVYRTEVGNLELSATLTGIGMRRAADAAEWFLDAARIDHVVVVGIAGGIGPSVAVGDLVVPELVSDLATGAAYRPTPLAGASPRGTLVTSDVLLTDRDEASHLGARGVVAIDMETAAVAAVCERRGCPWSVFRAISDRADDGSIDEQIFGLTDREGRPDALAVLRFVATRPWRLPQLARLGRDSIAAARIAATAAARALRPG